VRTPHGGTILVEDLTVVGRDGPAPHRLTARVEPGEVTVFTGPNGAGKSTTFEVILGLTPATDGRVLIGDTDIAGVDPQEWWARVSWLPQRPVLLPGTVRTNLELFGPLADIERACREAGFDEVLAALPDGLDTALGRGGVGLSLGQRQRLGLARALGSAAPVLLLDEPTAHLDGDTERRVLAAIGARARAGATVLMIGHRAPVLAAADRVITVGGGARVRT
jgi:ATP-binding cassette subfamily C protein CydD